MILADITVKGKPTKALVHFDRNGFGYTLDRSDRRAAGGREVRPAGELGDARRHEDRPAAGA
jgi:glucose dehydrogenase